MSCQAADKVRFPPAVWPGRIRGNESQCNVPMPWFLGFRGSCREMSPSRRKSRIEHTHEKGSPTRGPIIFSVEFRASGQFTFRACAKMQKSPSRFFELPKRTS